MQHPHLNNIASYLSLCEEVFDIAGATVAELVNETNALYGGRAISASRILWVNGVPYIYIYIYIYIIFYFLLCALYGGRAVSASGILWVHVSHMCVYMVCVSIWCVWLRPMCVCLYAGISSGLTKKNKKLNLNTHSPHYTLTGLWCILRSDRSMASASSDKVDRPHCQVKN
jgi:hypothetical protein